MTNGLARVGMREVAAQAGVSTQTVSRVLNDHPHIRPETRARVLAAADALGYRMNNAARALGTASTRTIGVIASDAALFGPAVGIAALEAAARATGRWITTAYADGSDVAAVTDAVEHLLTQGVDGIAVVAPHTASLDALERADLGVPVATLHGGAGAARQTEGAGLAVEHLVQLGHERIAVLAGPSAWSEAIVRERGANEALARHGLTAAARWEGDWSASTAAALAGDVAEAVASAGGPTAIAVANDQMALGLIAGLRERAVEVPHDVSVTGFDDNPDAGYYLPALTTVRLDLSGEARRCIDELLGAAAADGAGGQVSPDPPQLIARASSAPAS
jgi:DNA-binding LacI/PurR family transcriptional regulator